MSRRIAILGALGVAAAATVACADMVATLRTDRIEITTGSGTAVADYVFADPRVGRPSLRDLRTPEGGVVTRPCPPRPDVDPPDHPTMHPGVMLCFSDLSGHDPWRHKAAVRFLGFDAPPRAGPDGVTFTAAIAYLGGPADVPEAPVLCRERSTITIADREARGRPIRVVDWQAELTAGDGGVTFADVQEMGFGIRLARELTPRGGGRYLASHGGRDEAGVFGRQAEWCDASGTIDGRRCGVLLVDGEGNPRRPFIHARDSGWLLANHFGVHTYSQNPSGAITLGAGERLRLAVRYVLHGDTADGQLADLAAAVGPPRAGSLVPPEVLTAHVAEFNRLDPEDVVNAVPNADAEAWLAATTPRFDCPDADFVRVWNFRWWCLRKHLRRDDTGRWVFTEFITRPQPVSSALGHQLMEGRWLRDGSYLDDTIDHWLDPRQADRLHKYSQWLPYAVWQRMLVTGDADFATGRLDALIADQRRWEAERRRPDGLYWQYDVRDAMEESISGGRHEKNVRPPLNSYMAGSGRALAELARRAGRDQDARRFAAEAEDLRTRILATLWNPRDEFFEVVREDGSFADVREAIGFIPWYFAIPPGGRGYEAAWRQFTDERGFRAPCGITTAERRHPRFRSHGVGTCEWDGAVWPFATSQTLTALAHVLRGPAQEAVTNRDYFAALLTYARCHRFDGEPYLGEYLDETTGAWLKGRDPRSRWYNHSTFADLVITGLVGIVPRDDDTLELHPLLPDDAWDFFAVEGLRYRGHDLTIVWDRDGRRYGRGAGLSAWVDGRRVIHAPTLAPVSGDLDPR